MYYVVAYDIAHPRRLRRIAAFLERRALRHQKSVFVFKGSAADVAGLLQELAPLIHPRFDCVQAWKLAADQPPRGLVLGLPATLHPAFAVVGGGEAVFGEGAARK